MHFFQNFPTKQHFAWGHHSTNQAACRLAGPGNRPGRQMVCPQGETAEWSRMWMCPRNLTGSTLSTMQKEAIGNDAWVWSQGYLNQGEKLHFLHLLQAGKQKNIIVIHGTWGPYFCRSLYTALFLSAISCTRRLFPANDYLPSRVRLVLMFKTPARWPPTIDHLSG